MKYLALIYTDETVWEAMSDGERLATRDRYLALGDDMRTAGVFVAGDQLASTRDATTVRVQDVETLVTDGPYAEVKEALGGYYLLECESMDAAQDWAARIPAAERGAVEVRPLHAEPEGDAA